MLSVLVPSLEIRYVTRFQLHYKRFVNVNPLSSRSGSAATLAMCTSSIESPLQEMLPIYYFS